jgi:tRNA (guanine6-N2)-methyltransferase
MRRKKPARDASAELRPASILETYFELEVVAGLAEFAAAELEKLTNNQARLLPSAREDRVRFRYAGNPAQLSRLHRAVAVHRVTHFDIPRPKALLGNQNLETLIVLIEKTLALHGPESFKTFHISAAGSRSSVFARIKREVEARTGLRCTEEVGDLLLAVRRPQRLSTGTSNAKFGWEVAVRQSPRPLAARHWRVCDMPGALNGTVASTMMSLMCPSQEDRVMNLACGSGTLLIERLSLGPVQGAVGCDIETGALDCARKNLIASGNSTTVSLMRCDAGQVPLPQGWATTTCMDLPFGMLIGSHQNNEALYPRLLAEAGRLTVARGTLVAITQEVRLFERIAREQMGQWNVIRVIPLKLPASTRAGYIHSRIYLLRRR